MPDVIQSLWIGRLTTMERLCIRSFQDNGHEFHLYVYGDVGEVPSGTIIKDANEIVPETESKQFNCLAHASNLFHYELLLKNGGWFVDMDVVCLKPFDFQSEYVFYRDHDESTISCASVKTPPNSPVMKYCVDTVRGMAQKWKSLEYQDIGPNLTRYAVNAFGLTQFAQPGYVFDPIKWDRAGWLIQSGIKWNLSRAYALHLFHGAWNGGHEAWAVPGSHLLNTDDKYPDECLYEQLKRRYL